MKHLSPARPVTLRIDRIALHAKSRIEARRLADALPEALSACLRGDTPLPGPAAEAARQILRQIDTHLARQDKNGGQDG